MKGSRFDSPDDLIFFFYLEGDRLFWAPFAALCEKRHTHKIYSKYIIYYLKKIINRFDIVDMGT